jgi:hypothetical protein
MTRVKFIAPFLYADTVNTVDYVIKVDRGIGIMDGYLNDDLAQELIGLGLAQEVE